MTLHTQRDDISPKSETAAGQAGDALLTDGQIRWLRRAVVGMTAVLVAGIALLIGRVIYLARPAGTQAASATLAAAMQPNIRFVLPAGAVIKAMTADGNRMFISHARPGSDDEITVVDLTSGKVVSQITIERK